jgi:hypothetical protein
MRFKAIFGLVALGAALGLPTVTQAALIGAVYPPPGGNGLTSSGVGVDPGGVTNTYTLTDPSQYSSLYFVIDTTFAPDLYQVGNGPGTLTYNAGLSNLASGILAFTGLTTINSGLYGNLATSTELLVTLSGGSGLPLIDAGSLGLPTGDGAALNVGAGPFTANFQFEMSNAHCVLEAASTCYASINGGGSGMSLQSDVTGGFYYAAPVPLPAAAWLLLSGLGSLGLLGRKRKAV